MGNRNQYVEDEDEIFVAIDQMGANEITVTMLCKVQRYVSSDNFTDIPMANSNEVEKCQIIRVGLV
tara:strand:- start:502 stop:699 length:198 start_codon:yes stop_codon:yes gene_type:complete